MNRILLRAVNGPIATLTLNRPEKLNALNYALIDQLAAELDNLEADDGVRAIILTGAGDRAFSAGADIPQFAESVKGGRERAVQEFVRRGQRMTRQIENLSKPVIVAVNGLAYGGGCEITEAAPLAIASDDAVFAKSEIRLGMPPTFGGTQRLPRLIGRKRALEYLLTGESFSADRALETGLINAVVPKAAVMEEAQRFAERIVRYSPDAVAAILTATTRGLNAPIDEGLRHEREAFAQLVGTRSLNDGLARWIGRSTEN